jgi:SpoVK/Ycf46/Vps4 family AAA+-type ATPase
MNHIDFNNILNRDSIKEEIKNLLKNFNQNKNNFSVKRGIYIYGAAGIGKTQFINNILKELDYDIVNYDAGDIRNKSVIDTITRQNMADKSIISLFTKVQKPIAIVMDEIDGMNSGDKGGINSLIKLIRPKKTKKQKLEEISYNPIICISNYHIDKKINELMRVCESFEIPTPMDEQIIMLIKKILPKISNNNVLLNNLTHYIQGDLRKLDNILNIYKNKNSIIKSEIIENIFSLKSLNKDAKEITKNLLIKQYSFKDHNTLMNETDRTIVGLLFHENIIDYISLKNKKDNIKLYLKILNNICFSDYIDRITFQKQIWQFNEMSSLLKIFYNNKIFHQENSESKTLKKDIRFTKILTKYSTEYNNQIFIQNLCQQLNLDIKDMFSFFNDLKKNNNEEESFKILETYEISKLDINRINRYIERYNDYKVKISKNTDEDLDSEMLEIAY